MAYADHLRDRVTWQQRTNTADGGFGQASAWTNVLSVPARVTTLSGRASTAYQREGFDQVMRVECDDRIRRTNGVDSLQALLHDKDQPHYRAMYRTRTLNPIAVIRPLETVHDTASQLVFVDCIETPIRTGQMDAD